MTLIKSIMWKNDTMINFEEALFEEEMLMALYSQQFYKAGLQRKLRPPFMPS